MDNGDINRLIARFRRDILNMAQADLADTIEETANTIARKERGELDIRAERIFALLGIHSVLNARGGTPEGLQQAALDRLRSLVGPDEE